MDGYIRIGTEIDNSNFDAEINYIEGKMKDIEDKLKQADMGFEVGDTQKLEVQYSKLSKQLSKLVAKQKEMNQTDLSQLQCSIDKVGNSVNKAVSKVGKWALAVFGVRSAYMFVRQAMGTLSQYDDQMAINVQYISYLLASILKPIIETIIQLAYKLLTYINYIAQAWFGVNLFANASTKAFEKQNKALGKSTKQAKELKKQLAGFDEMNVLQDNGDVSSAGGGGAGGAGATMPNFPKMEDVPIPSWVQWIADNGDKVKLIIEGIGSAIGALKLAELLKTLGLFKNLKMWKLVAGLGLIIFGIIELIQDVIDFIKDPSWEKFGEILTDIGLILMGLAIIIGSIPLAVIAAVAIIVGLVISNWDKIKEVLGVVGGWIYDHIIKPVADFFAGLWNGIVNGVKTAIEVVKKSFTAVVAFFKNIINNIVNLFKTIGTKVGNVIGGAFKAVINGVLKAIENILNFPIRSINKLINVINKVPGINIRKLSEFNLPRLAKGGIINLPSRGVPVGGAIGGESGREGVIPLTDSQQMALLGEAIGKYININATVPVYVGNRQIAREIKRINAESDFAFNR